MGVFSQKVNKEDIKAGDHVYVWRALLTYNHHGIYVGENKVIHFTSDGNWNLSSSSSSSGFSRAAGILFSCPTFPECGVRKPNSGVIVSCLECFLEKGSPRLYQYGSSSVPFLVKRGGTCTTAKSDPAEIVIHRATYLLQNGYGKYDAETNNCEDFALYCKTGLIDKKGGGRSGQTLSTLYAPFSAILCSPLRFFFPTVVVAPVAAGMHCMVRYANDIGVRTDLTEVAVEDLAVKIEGLVEDAQAAAPNNSSTSSDSQATSVFFLCDCGAKAMLSVSLSKDNPGRCYLTCETRACQYFRWADQCQIDAVNECTENRSQEEYDELLAQNKKLKEENAMLKAIENGRK